MQNDNNLQLKLSDTYYYLNEQILLLWIFEEIHMAKIQFIDTGQKRIVDISGITQVFVSDILIPINLLGGVKRGDFRFF